MGGKGKIFKTIVQAIIGIFLIPSSPKFMTVVVFGGLTNAKIL